MLAARVCYRQTWNADNNCLSASIQEAGVTTLHHHYVTARFSEQFYNNGGAREQLRSNTDQSWYSSGGWIPSQYLQN